MRDLSGDGKLDVAVGITSKQHVSYALGQGNGQFTLGMPFIVIGSPDFLSAADLDGDGKNELIIGTLSMSSGQLLVRHYDSGNMVEDFNAAIPPSLRFMFVRDMDCDGLPDIVLYHAGTSQIDIYKNQGNRQFAAPPTSIDIGAPASALNFHPFSAQRKQDFIVVRTDGNHLLFVNSSQ